VDTGRVLRTCFVQWGQAEAAVVDEGGGSQPLLK
jgi:hypothetical protein